MPRDFQSMPAKEPDVPAPDRPVTRYGTKETNYNTPLSWDEELRFQKHKAIHSPRDSGEDYDERGAWLHGQVANQEQGQHGSDRWKKPNHPTFSEESIYASQGRSVGVRPGKWDTQTGAFTPGHGLLHQNLIDEIQKAGEGPTMRTRHAWERDK